jgi:hypothetical protein
VVWLLPGKQENKTDRPRKPDAHVLTPRTHFQAAFSHEDEGGFAHIDLTSWHWNSKWGRSRHLRHSSWFLPMLAPTSRIRQFGDMIGLLEFRTNTLDLIMVPAASKSGADQDSFAGTAAQWP